MQKGVLWEQNGVELKKKQDGNMNSQEQEKKYK